MTSRRCQLPSCLSVDGGDHTLVLSPCCGVGYKLSMITLGPRLNIATKLGKIATKLSWQRPFFHVGGKCRVTLGQWILVGLEWPKLVLAHTARICIAWVLLG